MAKTNFSNSNGVRGWKTHMTVDELKAYARARGLKIVQKKNGQIKLVPVR